MQLAKERQSSLHEINCANDIEMIIDPNKTGNFFNERMGYSCGRNILLGNSLYCKEETLPIWGFKIRSPVVFWILIVNFENRKSCNAYSTQYAYLLY